MNKLVVDRWCYSLSSTKEGELGYFLLKFLNGDTNIFLKISKKIIRFSLNCDKDFDWEYIKYGFENCDLPKEFQLIAKKRLTQIYTELSAFTIKSYIDRPELTFKIKNHESCFSSGHFLTIINLMNLTHEFSVLTTDELVKLKQSIEFRVFKEFYFSFIEEFDYNSVLTSQWFPVYKNAALSYAKSTSFDTLSFSSKIFSVFQSIGGDSKKYKKLLEILLNAYNSFNFLPIEAFFDIISSKSTYINRGNVLSNINSNKICSMNKGHEMISIFISHSSEDRTLAEEIVQLLTGTINIDDSEIRCSSLLGYSFEGVTHVSSTIKKEIQDAGIIIGIITSKSILSSYVLFELGAGWLLEKSIALLDKDIDFNSIPGPLRENHAFRVNVKTDLLSLIESVEKETGKQKKKSNIIEMKVNKLIQNIT